MSSSSSLRNPPPPIPTPRSNSADAAGPTNSAATTAPAAAAAGGATIQILCCTANIGNQQPNKASIRAWIPSDGLTQSVLQQPQQYPLGSVMKRKLKGTVHGFLDDVVKKQQQQLEQQQSLSGDNPKNDDETDPNNDNNNNNNTSTLSKLFSKISNGGGGVAVTSSDDDDDNDKNDTVVNTDNVVNGTTSFGDLTKLEGSRFDIIAIGMQEATFEPMDYDDDDNDSDNDNDESDHGTNDPALKLSSEEGKNADTSTTSSSNHSNSNHNHSNHNKPKTNKDGNLQKSPKTKKKRPVLKKLKEVQTVVTSADYNSDTNNSYNKNKNYRSIGGNLKKLASIGEDEVKSLRQNVVSGVSKVFHHSNSNSASSVGENSGEIDTTTNNNEKGSRNGDSHGTATLHSIDETKRSSLIQPPPTFARYDTMTSISENDSEIILPPKNPNTDANNGNNNNNNNVISDDQDQEERDRDDKLGNYDTQYIHTTLRQQLPSYKRIVSYQRGQMRLLVYYNQRSPSSQINDVTVVSVKAQNTGRAGLANKGGIVAELDVNDGTRISFLTAHLEAHEGESKYKTRCSTIGDILRGTKSAAVNDFGCDQSLSSHYMFAMGDLNFRTRLPAHEPGSEEHIKEAHSLARTKRWGALNASDELAMALRTKECLVGFTTPHCMFPPTFKVLRQNGYVYNEKRSPSYTDRILTKGNHMLGGLVEPLAYGPIDGFTTSDHKPMRGAYNVQLNSPLKWRPVLIHNNKSFRWNIGKPGKKVHGVKSNNSTSGLMRVKTLHLFCTGIECEVTNHKYASASPFDVDSHPSLFVSFISTPSETMKIVQKKKSWKKLLSFFKSKRKASKFDGVNGTQTQEGWPRTPTVPNALSARWDDEVHFKIRTHDGTGSPLNLTGSILHVVVRDERDSSSIIGSCTLNLAWIIKNSKMEDEKKVSQSPSSKSGVRRSNNLAMAFAARLWGKREGLHNSNTSSGNDVPLPVQSESSMIAPRKSKDLPFDNKLPSVRETHSLLDTSGEDGAHTEDDSRRESYITNAAGRNGLESDAYRDMSSNASILSNGALTSSSVIHSRPSNAIQSAFHSNGSIRGSSATRIDDLNIRCLRIDEAVTKNGKEIGRVRLTIDTWWLDEQVSNGEGLDRRRQLPGGRRAAIS